MRGDDLLKVLFVYSGDFAEKVIRNIINDPSYCNPCGLSCDYCKYGVYTHVRNIRAAIPLPSPSELPPFIDEPQRYIPQKIPEAELCIASGLHKDLLLELPNLLSNADVKALIVPIEDFLEVPTGLRKQVGEICQEKGLESAFPKPFCSLEPMEDKPLISRFVTELEVGKPILELSKSERGGCEFVESAVVKRSAPCGSTWYVAKKLLGVEASRERIYDVVAKAHHSFPCTATMNVDPELREPILHAGGYVIRKAFEDALLSSTSKA